MIGFVGGIFFVSYSFFTFYSAQSVIAGDGFHLFRLGAAPESTGYAWPKRSTPLLAVELYEQGKAMAVESLLKANADPNAQDPVSIHIHTDTYIIHT
jgi:hypothetical protein